MMSGPPISFLVSVSGGERDLEKLEALLLPFQREFLQRSRQFKPFVIRPNPIKFPRPSMTTNYKALVTSLSNVRPLPGADKLQLAVASGYTIIVSITAREGDTGLLIPDGCQLSEAFCLAHHLYRKHPITGEAMGGYLEPSGCVRSLTLRGVESQALFMSLESLKLDSFTHGGLLGQLQVQLATTPNEPLAIDTLPGFPDFVRKYETRAQRQAKAITDQPKGPKRPLCPIAKHYDTAQLREHAQHISDALQTPGAVATFTEKLHGTSGRTGKVYVDMPLAWYQEAWNFLAPKRWAIKPRRELTTVSGTRNVQLGTRVSGEAAMSYRAHIHDYFASRLLPGEIVYYEIVGYSAPDTPIMATHSLAGVSTSELPAKQLKALRKEYGNDSITYSYGCRPNDGLTFGLTFPELLNFQANVLGSGASVAAFPLYRVFVYRIVRELNEGVVAELHELSMREMEARMHMLGWPGYVEMVPTLGQLFIADAHGVIELANELTRGSSTLDSSHPREGVCVRVDTPDRGGVAFKHKSFLFCVLEGIRANDPDFVDVEDAA